MSYSDLKDDIWHQILLYLDLKSIYCLELANPFFPTVLKRLRLWNIKITKDFPHRDVVINSVQEEEMWQEGFTGACTSLITHVIFVDSAL